MVLGWTNMGQNFATANGGDGGDGDSPLMGG